MGVIKETGSKVGCFAGFCQHRVMTMSAHTHVYRYPLFESGTEKIQQITVRLQ